MVNLKRVRDYSTRDMKHPEPSNDGDVSFSELREMYLLTSDVSPVQDPVCLVLLGRCPLQVLCDVVLRVTVAVRCVMAWTWFWPMERPADDHVNPLSSRCSLSGHECDDWSPCSVVTDVFQTTPGPTIPNTSVRTCFVLFEARNHLPIIHTPLPLIHRVENATMKMACQQLQSGSVSVTPYSTAHAWTLAT